MTDLKLANACREAEEDIGVVTGTIYMLLNLINGKRYVGQTFQLITKRWVQHIVDSHRGFERHLCNAIRKYGADAFYVRVLAEGIPASQLDVQERFWIRFYGTFDNGVTGYNHTEGGSGGRHSDATKTKISIAGKAHWGSLTPEQRAEHGAKSKAWWESLTPEQRAEHGVKSHVAWHSLTPEEQAEYGARRLAEWEALTPEEQAEHGAKTSAMWEAFTPEEHAELCQKISTGVKASWDSLTPEERAKRGSQISAGRYAKKRERQMEAGQLFLV